MNQFVIEMTGSRPELRPGFVSDSRLTGAGRIGPIRPAWPFLVNSSSRGDKQMRPQEAGRPTGFAS